MTLRASSIRLCDAEIKCGRPQEAEGDGVATYAVTDYFTREAKVAVLSVVVVAMDNTLTFSLTFLTGTSVGLVLFIQISTRKC